MNRFEEILKEISPLIGIPLHVDKHGICRLNINGELFVQLEYDESKERLLIASFLCDMPPGKYRENLLKEALKANHARAQMGILSYCQRNNKLALFDYLYSPQFPAAKLIDCLAAFIERSFSWKKSVESGSLPAEASSAPKSRSTIFDLKP